MFDRGMPSANNGNPCANTRFNTAVIGRSRRMKSRSALILPEPMISARTIGERHRPSAATCMTIAKWYRWCQRQMAARITALSRINRLRNLPVAEKWPIKCPSRVERTGRVPFDGGRCVVWRHASAVKREHTDVEIYRYTEPLFEQQENVIPEISYW